MIELNIGLDGVVSERKIKIGNKYENNDEVINFTLPSEFDNYHKYIVAVIKQDEVVISVSTGGSSPLLAATIKKDIQENKPGPAAGGRVGWRTVRPPLAHTSRMLKKPLRKPMRVPQPSSA